MDKKISFIGLGAMGGPMATNIIKKGIELFVYDIDENKKNKVYLIDNLSKNIQKKSLSNLIDNKNVKFIKKDLSDMERVIELLVNFTILIYHQNHSFLPLLIVLIIIFQECNFII